MYIFRRNASIRPERMMDGMAFAVTIAAQASAVIGRPISVFNTVYGQPMGSIGWTCRMDSLADAHDVATKLAGDPGYMEAAVAGTDLFAGPASDALTSIVSSSLTPAVQRFYASTVATMANGKAAEAMAFGVQVQSLMASKGFNTAFGTSTFGTYGEVGWLTGADTMAELDRFTAVLAEPEVARVVISSGPLFNAGSGHNMLVERIN